MTSCDGKVQPQSVLQGQTRGAEPGVFSASKKQRWIYQLNGALRMVPIPLLVVYYEIKQGWTDLEEAAAGDGDVTAVTESS